ncbi:Zn-dependent alcohol dehydrogenase [Brevibacterium ammoniilyticum]|uniref:Zn-dependent alcohol dehydrogenase n=1 Tax=Brevibacterium ammoniilyticum TaxID=1046555 RepID=A0ABP9U1D6_9MICO
MPTISRAAVHTDGPELEITEVVVRDPGPGQVLVKLGASGVCGSDRHVLDGDWNLPSPTVMGHEGAGTVVSIGAGVTDLDVGDHVVLSWFYPCLHCAACRAGRMWVCTGSGASDGLLPDGTTAFSRGDGSVFPYLAVGSMSEYTVVAQQAAVKIPDAVPFDVAALIGCSIATGFGAVVNDGDVTAGQSALVIGAGGIGLSIIMSLALAGANPIIAADVSGEALALAAAFGATHTLTSGPDLATEVKEITGTGVDCAFEAIGRRETIELMTSCAAPGGTAVIVGLPPEDDPVSIDALHLAEEGKRLVGSNYGSTVPARDFPRLADLYLAGKLPIDRLITDRIRLDEVNSAFAAMRAGSRGRTVIVH